MVTIGAIEAEAQLPKLLDRVEAGESIIITRKGEEVAYLVPPPERSVDTDAAEAVAQWREARKGLKLDAAGVRELINQGRR